MSKLVEKHPTEKLRAKEKFKFPKDWKDTGRMIKEIYPYAIAVGLIVISYLVLFSPGFGLVGSVQAQVNLGRAGEVVTDTVTEAASETAGEFAETEGEIAKPGRTEEEAAGEEISQGELPPGETGQVSGDEKEQAVYVGPGSPYYVDPTGIGGKNITELTREEMQTYVLQMKEVEGSMAIVNAVMPILVRFQAMVRPPEEQFEEGKEPWRSGSRRYSPFDPVGTSGEGPRIRMQPIPPFPGQAVGGSQVLTGPTAAEVASAIRIKGIIGEFGKYMAIITIGGEEKVLGVGDTVVTLDDVSFVITEISMESLRIVNSTRETDTGLAYFVRRESSGIAEMSISY